MKARVIENSLRNIFIGLETKVNRALGREFIPVDLGPFNIETSSACNLKCRFCAYEKKTSPKLNMPNDMFYSCVEQAIEMGFRKFHLTPCTGDVFMDKQLFDKLAFMEAHPRIEGYHFFSNITIPRPDQLLRLKALKKFERLTISVYGHDEESFVAITKSPAKIYRRLLTNMATILENKADLRFAISIGFRSTFDVPAHDASELMKMLSAYRKAGVNVHSSHGVYNNWGGSISQADVGDLNLHIATSDSVPKNGACVKIFDSIQVMATGVVNACSCRDVDATLRIGDIGEAPLKEILSANNPMYLQVIAEQQEGRFRPVCENCDYYRSIYHQPRNYRREKIPTQTIDQFIKSLSAKV